MNSTNQSTRINLLAGAAALIVMVLAFFVFGGSSDSPDVAASDNSASPATTAPSTTLVETIEPSVRFSDLPVVEPADLPIEAIDTLLLIADGGPYPYRQDDGVFQNREGILPNRDNNHYREYTVDTPGSSDRGARRVVSGADGELYYTNDHYDSFREIGP